MGVVAEIFPFAAALIVEISMKLRTSGINFIAYGQGRAYGQGQGRKTGKPNDLTYIGRIKLND